MLNVHDLERRWLRYKIKSYAPVMISTIFILFGFIAALIYYPFSSRPEAQVDEVLIVSAPIKASFIKEVTFSPVTENIQENTLNIDVPQNTQYTRTSRTLVLKPSLHFMDNIEEGINPYLSDVNEEPLAYEIQQHYTNNISQVNEQVQTKTQTPIVKKKMLTIVTQKNENDLKDVIRRFKNNKNPALSLFIAKRYYELKKYQKSYNYALMTNEIDKEIDDSWIIFCKSLVKLGQHELAVVTLKTYLKTNKSSQAKILLRKIQAGNFR
ncbi:MAG: hypothetical protein COA44_04445 [Arcobacter sp.]|nr:MAG: hypothetical protein COA44_04445 [Arcobacter sp.]